MRILVTNNALSQRAGTEAYLAAISRELRARGHQLIAYSPILGAVAGELRQIGLTVTDDLARVPEPPDVIHGQHHLETMTALLHFPATPAVYTMHGGYPWEETPPRFPRILRYLAVNPYERERLIAEHGISRNRTGVTRNAVDLHRYQPRGPLPDRPRRALVFSNEATLDGWAAAIRAACASAGIALDVAGVASGRPMTRPWETLGRYDLVFAHGRAALEALAIGTAVILCGNWLLGPLVDTHTCQGLYDLNMAGSVALRFSISEQLVAERIAAYDPAEAEAVSQWIRGVVGVDRLVDQLEALYHDVVAEFRAARRPSVYEECRQAAAYIALLSPHLKGRSRDVDELRTELAVGAHYARSLEEDLERHRVVLEQATAYSRGLERRIEELTAGDASPAPSPDAQEERSEPATDLAPGHAGAGPDDAPASTTRPDASPTSTPSGGAGRRAHLVGIGGNGMSALAGLLLESGWRVTGSDTLAPDQWLWPAPMQRLLDGGSQIFLGHDPAQVPADADVVVYSAAVPADNVELERARQLGIRLVNRAEMLGTLMHGRASVAVVGNVGKSTTTAMLATIARMAGLDPTVYVGAGLPAWGDLNYCHGAGPLLIAELDDSDLSFPVVEYALAIVTNVHHIDHPDSFADEAAALDAFVRLTARARCLVVNRDDPPSLRFARRLTSPYVTVGLSGGGDWRARLLEATPAGTTVEVLQRGRPVASGVLRVPGQHNVMNALAAIAGAAELGVEPTRALAALGEYRALRRRLERLPDIAGRVLYWDFAHNWVQLQATIPALRQLHPEDRLVSLFIPPVRASSDSHLDRLEASFPTVAAVGILRPPPLLTPFRAGFVPMTTDELTARFVRHGLDALTLDTPPVAARWLLDTTEPGDVVLLAGLTQPIRDTVAAMRALATAFEASAVPTPA